VNATHFYLFGECYVADPENWLSEGSVTSCIGFVGAHTTGLYDTVAVLAIGGLALAIAASGMGLQLLFARRPLRVATLRIGPWMAIMPGILLLTAALVLMAGQPWAFTMDGIHIGCGTGGPTQNFWGSCSVSSGWFYWTADLGWVLCACAGIILLIGGVFFLKFGKSLLLHGQVSGDGELVKLPPDVL
jgi:hypothetical protein